MDELIQRFLDLLQTGVITLGEEPIKVIQIVWLISGLVTAPGSRGFFTSMVPTPFR